MSGNTARTYSSAGLSDAKDDLPLYGDVHAEPANPNLLEAEFNTLDEKEQKPCNTWAGRQSCLRFVFVSLASVFAISFYLSCHDSSADALTNKARTVNAPQADVNLVQLTTGTNNELTHICNPVLPEIQLGPRKFNLASPWNEMCTNLTHPKWSWEIPGQNWCWIWMKNKCYARYGQTTWEDVRVSAASEGHAPPTNAASMSALEAPSVCDRTEFGAPLHQISTAEQQAAYAWFGATVSVYVLNLPKDVQRWYMISHRLGRLGIQFSRIDGVDLTPPGAISWAQNAGLIPKTWSHSRSIENARTLAGNSAFNGVGYMLAWAGIGTVGCATAHINAIRQAENLTRASGRQIALILEDDTWLDNDFVVKAFRLMRDEVPCDWQILSLSSGCPYGTCVAPHLARIQLDDNGPRAACGVGNSYGMYAMMYKVSTMSRVRERLIQTVFDESRPTCISVDTAVAAISADCPYYAVPYLQRPGFLHPNIMGDSTRLVRNHAKLSPKDARMDAALRTKGLV